MATACISYESLERATLNSFTVSKKLDKYADNLYSQVYRRLTGYNGSRTSNIEQAENKIYSKISELRIGSEAYAGYARDLFELKEQCVATDKAVKSNVSKLTSQFKSANGIQDNAVVNVISYFLTSIENKTPFRRFIGNTKDEFDSVKDYIKQRLKDWLDYEGGKELVKGVLIATLEAVIAVCGIVSAFLSGGFIVAVVAGIVAGALAFINAGVNLYNEIWAYKTTNNGDPATGRRRSDINTAQDYLRSSFYYGSDGEEYEYDSKLYLMALGIDAVNFVCAAITFVDGCGKLIKNAYKWTTGSLAKTGDLRVKNILTKENFSAFKSKVAISFKNGFKDIKFAIKAGDYSKIKTVALDFKTDFIANLKKGYTFETFADDEAKKDFIRHGAGLVKNYATIPKDLLKGRFGLSNVFNIFSSNFGIVGTTTLTYGENGQGTFKFETIKLHDVTGKIVDSGKLIGEFVDLGKSIGEFVDLGELIDKFIQDSNISVSIPTINVPQLTGINEPLVLY